jgi:hypothetical protein
MQKLLLPSARDRSAARGEDARFLMVDGIYIYASPLVHPLPRFAAHILINTAGTNLNNSGLVVEPVLAPKSHCGKRRK